MRATGRRNALRTAVVILSLPLALAVVEAAWFHLANRNNGRMVSSGERREYLLHVPRSYHRGTPTPLVISLHGAALWPAAQQTISHWSDEAERQGFIVVYPSGVDGDGPRSWHATGRPGLEKDAQFISALIDTLSVAYSIDPSRIYADGLSNGGGMAFVLSCTLSDRIAAVGLVGAAHLLPWSWCTDKRPVPMIAFHGTADRAAPYHGGVSLAASQRFPGIPDWTALWARRNGCGASAVASTVAADVTRIEYLNCADHASVVLYRIEGGGHTWPGGRPLMEWFLGPTSQGIDATAVMWQFFREHPLPGR